MGNFSTFQMDNNFYILIGLFLLITFIISTIVVFFVSRIKTLSGILERAKEIDSAKESRMSVLNKSLKSEKIKVVELQDELEFHKASNAKLKLSEERVLFLERSIQQQAQRQLEKNLEQQNSFEQLSANYALLEKNYIKMEDKYGLLKKRNEDLVDHNNRLHTEIREYKLRIKEEILKRNSEKAQINK